MRTQFSQNLIRLRKEKGLSQQDLANLTGISQRMIAYYETKNANPAFKNIELLAKALSTNPSALTGYTNDPKEKKSLSDVLTTNPRTLKQIQKLLALNKSNRNTVYKIIDSLLKEQQEKIKDI